MAEIYECGCTYCIHNKDGECNATGVVIDYVKFDEYDVLTCTTYTERSEEDD